MSTRIAAALRGRPELIASDDTVGRARFLLDPNEPVFAGHYPGAPILPGVCLIEAAHHAARAMAFANGMKVDLIGLNSARFQRPVRPGDELELALTGQRSEGNWLVRAELTVAQQPVARIVLRYDPSPIRELTAR